MVNLFELFSILLLFIVFTQCGARQDHRRINEIHGRRSNKYFKFQPRKENKAAVALFRTSVEDLPCPKNTELPMSPGNMATTTAEPDYGDYEQPRPSPQPINPASSDYNNDAPSESNPGTLKPNDFNSDSEEQIDLNVNIVITNMPNYDESDPEDYGKKTVPYTHSKRTTRLSHPYPQTKPTTLRPRPTYSPNLPPKPPKTSKVTPSDYYQNAGTENTESAEEIDINVVVLVTEMPEEEDDINGNTIAYQGNEDLGDENDPDYVDITENMAVRIATNTLVGLASFCSSFALTNYFFY